MTSSRCGASPRPATPRGPVPRHSGRSATIRTSPRASRTRSTERWGLRAAVCSFPLFLRPERRFADRLPGPGPLRARLRDWLPCPAMSSPGLRRGLVAVAGLGLAIGVVAVVVLVSLSSASTHAPSKSAARPAASPPVDPPAPPPLPPPPPPKPRPAPTDDPWPFYGYNLARTRAFPPGAKLNPPFRGGWQFHDGALLEFPPVIYANTLYFQDANGWATALASTTGHAIWRR